MQRFLPFLPPNPGSAGWHDPEYEESLIAIVEELEELLSSDGPTFWAIIQTDASFAVLVATFLKNSNRPFDVYTQTQSSSYAEKARELLLAALLRCACQQEDGCPSTTARSSFLGSLFDLPTVLDLAAVYAATHAQQLSQLIQVLFLQDSNLESDLASAATLIATNLQQVVEACLTAAAKASGQPDMLQSVADGVLYLRDVCLTLCALLKAYPPAAVPLLHYSGVALLEGFAAVHDLLLPAVAKLAAPPSMAHSSVPGSSAGDADSSARPLWQQLFTYSTHLELSCERAVFLILTHAYLSPHAAAGGAGGSSSSVSTSQSTQRGEQLLNCIMALGHREEEGRDGVQGGGSLLGGLSLGQALAERHGLGGAVEVAIMQGHVILDEAQTAYLAALLGVSSLEQAPAPVPHPPLGHCPAQGGLRDPGGMDSAVLASQISQIKDLLPDYGDGYLAVCLDAYDGSAEKVIDALLGDSLYPQLDQLDPQMSLQQYQEQYSRRQGAAAAGDASTKGKEKMPVEDQRPGTGAGGTALPQAPQGGSSAGTSWAGAASSTGAAGSSGGAGVPKPRPEAKTAKYLDVREETYRESLLSTATAMQWEYEDEYDDSFDDLISYKADGVTEAEGEEGGASSSGFVPHRTVSGAVAAAQRGMVGLSLGHPSQPRGSSSGDRQGLGGSRAAPGQPQPSPAGGKAVRNVGPGKTWILDGRIYNYPKPGAKAVASRAEALQLLEEAENALFEIHGLGPGGNKPLPPSGAQQWRHQEQEEGDMQDGQQGVARGAGREGRGGEQGGRGKGGQQGGEGEGRGRGRGGSRDHRLKDQHKSSIANHNRKDRARKKAAQGSFG